ncbi:shikimate dehydrogenase [Candidatus Peregrinibacteria bacterium]|nr:shikimate dehydrogenase [Candidatus Peregrinibacteria bacterium]
MSLYGVVGYPIKHSMSPQMFEAAFYEYNMDDEYRLFQIAPEELENFIKKDVNDIPIKGLSVTIPHKEKIIPFLDSIDKHAAAIGAVNTVHNVNGKLKGYNTDWIGATRAMEFVGKDCEGKFVVILGAGGAAAAVAYGCVQSGARVAILNRTLERAQALADKLGCQADTLSNIFKYPAHVLIQTTSVGMYPNINASLVDPDYFKKGMIVMDIVYNPIETKLVREAKRAECRIVPGYKMLLYQGEKQFEIWFGKKPRTEKMEEALLTSLNN